MRRLDGQGMPHYIVHRGAYASGVVMLKINGLGRGFRLMIQQRDIDGRLGWEDALGRENVEEAEADAYIARSTSRDPDLWVVEIEDRGMVNPFEEIS